MSHKGFQDDAGVRKANNSKRTTDKAKSRENTRTGAANQEDRKGNTGTLDRTDKGKQTKSRR